MHIGLIGGIGPAATEFYYRALVRSAAAAGKALRLTIAHADMGEVANNLVAGERAAQAAIFARHVDQLRAGGCEAVAVTSMAGHFCINELAAIASLPIIDAIPILDAHFASLGMHRVGVLGTQPVMASKLYGLSSVEVVVPSEDDIPRVHASYMALAATGIASDVQRRFFEAQALKLQNEQGAEAIVLGGTDLFLAFDQADYAYPVVDSAAVHAEAIAKIALQN